MAAGRGWVVVVVGSGGLLVVGRRARLLGGGEESPGLAEDGLEPAVDGS
jgi:hypothetical protein